MQQATLAVRIAPLLPQTVAQTITAIQPRHDPPENQEEFFRFL